MIFKQVTFVPVNPKCVSLKPITYSIDTLLNDSAKRKALSLLNEEAHHERYRLISIVDVTLHPCC